MARTGTCYYCNTKVDISELKRCGRCRLTTYCSKTCQSKSWKAGHRRNCQPHVSLSADCKDPEEGTQEWMDLQVDKVLSRWIECWRSVFQTYAMMALDLPNSPPEKVATHCMTLWIEPNIGHDDRTKDYLVTKAEVKPTAELQAMFPTLKGIVDDVLDVTRVKFVVILSNFDGEIRRVRCCQWNVPNLPDRSTDEERKASSGPALDMWPDMLMYMVENMQPKDMMERR